MPAISITAGTVAGSRPSDAAHLEYPIDRGLSLHGNAGRPEVCGAVVGWGQRCAVGSPIRPFFARTPLFDQSGRRANSLLPRGRRVIK